ncbi:efflux RND transporter periplasmic adaptor subunit [Clostridium omnivorum]|uniref:Hemolysin D n=1 Tax=Clostridium omnivorum TaxID=1604902 RepID=A0ABQ5N1V4_9CLOT|nr:efflux RND transporter periplasmic adaptor subunit [Clostridium sp. E14]GLC29189.1 hemolysin D [Clostridium sp. E14]
MKSKLIKAIIACVVVAVIGVGGYYGYNAFFTKKTVAASVQYLNTSVRKMNLQVTVQGTGTAYAATTKDVSPSNNGNLKDLSLKVGDTVTAGQKLFTSDSDDLRKNVTTAKNNLTKQNLTLTSDESAEKVDDNKVAMDKLSVSDATAQLADANTQLSKMTVTSPIGGTITAINNSNGDSVQSGKSVLTVVDMNSIKVKVSVDELDIGKIKAGQKATIKFDALKDKSFEGSVETIAQTGTTSNNVTTYDVVVAVSNPTGIKLGMNANVTIAVESKENALVIPAEALVENNGQKFVRVEATNSTTNSTNNNQNSSNQQTSNNQNGTPRNNAQVSSSNSKLVAIKTGLETENYIEVTEGLTEGEKVLIKMPSTSSNTNNNNKNNLGGFGGNMGGGPGDMGGAPGGNNGGGTRSSSNGNSGSSGSTKN